jgi:hypothetical protein
MKKVADNVTESWLCVDCGVDTAPGIPNGATIRAQVALTGGSNPVLTADSELYHVRDKVWAKAGMEPWGGCLCVGCLERRPGRKLKPEDFPHSTVLTCREANDWKIGLKPRARLARGETPKFAGLPARAPRPDPLFGSSHFWLASS